jgi:hypothetical protein
MLGTLFLFLAGFAGTENATARDISDECKADIRALFERCASECGRDFRCFLRCVVTNFPDSCY